MPIQRAGETPPFVELPLRYVVTDSAIGTPPQAVTALNPTRITIPSFQRGIEWGEGEVEDLLNSSAVLYGTIILGSFPGQDQVLIDGLQRFATTTALLDCLYLPVLQPNPVQQAAAPFFSRLKARVAYFHPLIEFNREALRQHNRPVIRRSFLHLLMEVDDLVKTEVAPGKVQSFAARTERMLLDRQIALDPYFNFGNLSQMTGTFVNLNTSGLQLSSIDLVRSRIVDRASDVGWTASEIARVEGRFTDVFETTGPKGYMRSLAKAIDEVISDAGKVGCLFPNWSRLSPAEVDSFLEFIELSITQGQGGNSGYFRELFQCSPAMFALTTLYYYRESLQHSSMPSFLPGGTRVVDPELHQLLRAAYRRVIDGTIFRVGDMISDVVGAPSLSSIAAVSDMINAQNPCGPMGSTVGQDWLSQRLRETEGTRSRRVFNACLLPTRAHSGGQFSPLDFGRRSTQFTLDHLIPASQIASNSPAEREGETVANLAPLLMQHNRQASATLCSLKLAPAGIYDAQRGQMSFSHPYLDWLLDSHFQSHLSNRAALDDPLRLRGGSSTSIGEERIAELTSILAPVL